MISFLCSYYFVGILFIFLYCVQHLFLLSVVVFFLSSSCLAARLVTGRVFGGGIPALILLCRALEMVMCVCVCVNRSCSHVCVCNIRASPALFIIPSPCGQPNVAGVLCGFS